MRPQPGPYKTLTTHDGISVPFYIVRFDKQGKSDASNAIAEIIDKARTASDIFFFAHGWNNDWSWATKRYESFFEEYSKLRQQHHLTTPKGYKPMMVGVFWPSAALAFGASERGPTNMTLQDMAAQDMDADYAEDQFLSDLEEIAESLDDRDRELFYALVRAPDFGHDEARQLAELLAKGMSDTLGERDHAGGDVNPQVLLDSWAQATGIDIGGGGGNQGPYLMNAQIQGKIFKPLAPLRSIARLLTFAPMKDRAGVIGRVGVSTVLQQLLDHSQAKIHLIGHSYGTKVMLSALGNTDPKSRKVHSALLLQPAISHLAFADRLPGKSGTGGYYGLPDRVEAPIFSTFSSQDSALYRFFHWGLIRNADVGEVDIQWLLNEQPNRYAALGGYGPRQSGERLIPLQTAAKPYRLEPHTKIYGLDGSGSGQITGHGEVINPDTAWALHSLVWHGRPHP
ncbi:hypothetical protein ACMHYJ_10690 [Castellaniella hirudinis]|uniref:hypothetical protein n=1 Tax=Castellaniella hirudinis TaxID=1144617 RepID=UPI0039C1E5E6